jgi:transposase-like protein
MAFHFLASAKNGLSSHELGRLLDISHESAWFMSHRLRYAFAPSGPQAPLTGIVEADETYIGGKRKHIPGVGPVDLKTPVVTLVQRHGEARSQVMPEVTGDTIKRHLTGNITPDSNLMTDESSLYNKTDREFASHERVQNRQDEYVRGHVPTNTAEGYFSQLKRSIDGTHHHVSARHLQRYVSEFDFRYDTRKETDGERTVKAIKKSAGKRLQYKDATHKP